MPHAVIHLEPAAPAALPALRESVRAWRASHAAVIDWCYRVTAPAPPARRRAALLVSAPRDALAALPAGARAELLDPPLAPRRAQAALVRDALYEHRGALVRGTSHFAPGAVVYVAGPYSGDGFARTYMVGPDRDTGRFVALMGPTARLGRWHIAEVTHPAALYTIRTAPGEWTRHRDGRSLAEVPVTPPPRLAWQPVDAWARLVARFFTPDRPRLAECAAAVLDCDLAFAQARVADGTVGSLLADLEKGRYRRGAGDAVVRSGAAAWERLAPPTWLAADAAQRRAIARRDLMPIPPLNGSAAAGSVTTRPTPRSVSDAVALASAPEGVATAEALGQQIAASLPERAADPRRIVWHVVTLNDVLRELTTGDEFLEPGPDGELIPLRAVPLPARVRFGLRRLETDVAIDEDRGAVLEVERLREAAASLAGSDPTPALLDLLALGYALLDVTPDAIHLACPALARPRLTRS